MVSIPDGILAVITQFVLGIGLATSAVPPTVLSFQDRASETMGVFIVLVLTAAVAFPVRNSFGQKDISASEYIVVVLAPILTRLDLVLLMWVNINKALLWVQQILFAPKEEIQCVSLLILASKIWHNGDNRIFDPEFGFYGGEAGMVMYYLMKDYNPKNASGNTLAWISHVTLWPISMIFHYILQLVALFGFLVFWALQQFAGLIGRKNTLLNYELRASYLDFTFRRRKVQHRKLFMRHEVSRAFDSNQALISENSKARYKWAMLASVDAILSHKHFKLLFEIAYPMRAPIVLQRSMADSTNLEIRDLLSKNRVLFQDFTNDPLPAIGTSASQQILLYRVLGWPKHSKYSETVLQNLEKFADHNMSAWKATFERVKDNRAMSSEFTIVRDVLRRALVQLVIIAWCDGLGECLIDKSRQASVSQEISKVFLQGSLNSVEMSVRLINLESSWNDHRQTSEMVLDLKGPIITCMCDTCSLMNSKRRLSDERYLSRETMDELEQTLRNTGCSNAIIIPQLWRKGVEKWITGLFDP